VQQTEIHVCVKLTLISILYLWQFYKKIYLQLLVDRDKAIGNESVPIQLAQCWFRGMAISNAKIQLY